MVSSQDAIPLEDGSRIHDCTPFGGLFRLADGFGRDLHGLKTMPCGTLRNGKRIAHHEIEWFFTTPEDSALGTSIMVVAYTHPRWA